MEEKRYKYFKIDYSKPFGCVADLYNQYGILDAMREEKIRRGYQDPDSVTLNPNLVTCTKETQEKLVKAWEQNWRWYNYDRLSGAPKTKELKKYKRAHPLDRSDKSRISFNFYLGIGPGSDEEVEPDVLRVNLDWDDEKDVRSITAETESGD